MVKFFTALFALYLLVPNTGNAVVTCNYYVPIPFAIPVCSTTDEAKTEQVKEKADDTKETNKEKRANNDEVEAYTEAIGYGRQAKDEGMGQAPQFLDHTIFESTGIEGLDFTDPEKAMSDLKKIIEAEQDYAYNGKESAKSNTEKRIQKMVINTALRNLDAAQKIQQVAYEQLKWATESSKKAVPVSKPVSKLVRSISGDKGAGFGAPAGTIQNWVDNPGENRDMVDFMAQENKSGDYNKLFNGTDAEQTQFLQDNGITDPQKIANIKKSANNVPADQKEEVGGFFNGLDEKDGLMAEFTGMFGEFSRLMDNLNLKKRQVTVRSLENYNLQLKRMIKNQETYLALTEALRMSLEDAQSLYRYQGSTLSQNNNSKTRLGFYYDQ